MRKTNGSFSTNLEELASNYNNKIKSAVFKIYEVFLLKIF